LDILVNPEYVPEIKAYVMDVGATHYVDVVHGQLIPYDKLVQTMQFYSVVVQPSRAEGFGLVPLEARACGIPVVMTNSTGHSDHFDPESCMLVQSGSLEESDDYWGARAPTVKDESILEALVSAKDQIERLEVGAERFAHHHEWSWANHARHAVEELRNG
jgi:glycosyltransferase involved in cell wall biosynthesis